ncbi:MAG: hypothetical protein IKA50_06325 [Clostridia bacterium]|nr:hypothetical protein [Clostridia bacterium]
MKSYREIANSVFERRERYIAAQQRKRKHTVSAITSICSCALVALVGASVWRSGVLTEDPPLSDSLSTTTVTRSPVTEGTAVGTAPSASHSGIVSHTTPTTSVFAPSQTTTPSKTQSPTVTTTPSKTQPTATTPSKTEPTKTNPTQPTASQTRPTATQTQPTQTTPTTQPTITDPSGDDPVEPLPEWPYLWIIYESGENYANGEVPIYFKLEGFEEVPFDWVKETSYTADGFSVVGDITVERDAETGALIYRMVLAYDGVTPKPSFFFSVVTADGMKQTDGLYGYPAPHGFFVSPSYDSAFSASQYYLVETGVITLDEYQAIMEKYWSQFGFEFSIVVDDNSH